MWQAKWNHFQFQLGRMSGLDRTAKQIQLSATRDDAGHELVPEGSLGVSASLLLKVSRAVAVAHWK